MFPPMVSIDYMAYKSTVKMNESGLKLKSKAKIYTPAAIFTDTKREKHGEEARYSAIQRSIQASEIRHSETVRSRPQT